MKTTMKLIVIAAIGLLIVNDMALGQTAKDFLDDYIAPLKMHNTPILYTECSYSGGKLLIIFPLGVSEGRLVELSASANRRNPPLANEGKFTVGSQVEIEDLMSGGPGTFRAVKEIIENLLSTSFTMLYPKDLDSVVTSEPKTKCRP